MSAEWVCIRKATEEDEQRLQEREQAFLNRHSYMIPNWYDPHSDSVYFVVKAYSDDYKHYTGKLPDEWYAYRKVVARALGHPDAQGIAWGYIGHPEK